MCDLERYKIDLKGLNKEVTIFEWDLDKQFFDALDQTEVESGALHVSLSIRKASGFFELLFHTVGNVEITCDRCLDLMEQPIATDNRLLAKLGSTDSEDDDTVTVDENEGILDTAWLIYEFISLAIPIKHVHAPGKCNAAMSKLLSEHDAARSSEAEEAKAVDPRWEALLKLKK